MWTTLLQALAMLQDRRPSHALDLKNVLSPL
jgi:hypothetical protein